MTRRPKLRQLRYFDALARERHFGRAAEACFVSQSTLSAGVHELEQVLGAPLVDRSRRALALTPAGEDVLARARRILDEVDELVEAAAAAGEPLSGALRMGVIPTIAPFLLPRVLPEIRRRWPKLRLYLIEDLTARLVEELHAGRIDIAMLALPCDCGPVDTETLFVDRFEFACPASHPLGSSERVVLEDIDPDALLLLDDAHCLSEHALNACGLSANRRPRPFSATSLHTLVQMVDNGFGITLLPRLAIDGGILKGTSLVTRPLAGERPGREIGLVWRRGAARSEEFKLLARYLAHEEST